MSYSTSIQAVELCPHPDQPGRPRDLPTNSVMGTLDGHSCDRNAIAISVDDLNSPGWFSSAVTARLGHPLKLKQVLPAADASNSIYSRQINSYLAIIDPKSPHFGKYSAPPLYGKVIVAREDGEDLDVNGIEIFTSFFEVIICGNLETYTNEPDQQEWICKRIDSLVEPHFFRKWWNTIRVMFAVDAREPIASFNWRNLECPVGREEKPLACEKCGKTEAEGTKLRKCGACKNFYYCGKECQAEDWKAHRPECRVFVHMREEAKMD